MDFEKLTDRSKELMQDVINLAAANRNQYITPLHLLKVLLDDKNDLIVNLILKAGGSITQIRDKVETAFAKLPQVAGSGDPKPDVSGFHHGDDGSRKAGR